MIETHVVREKIPESLLAPTCPKTWAKKGGPEITQDFVDRGDTNEDGLACREMKLEGIRQWNSGQE